MKFNIVKTSKLFGESETVKITSLKHFIEFIDKQEHEVIIYRSEGHDDIPEGELILEIYDNYRE